MRTDLDPDRCRALLVGLVDDDRGDAAAFARLRRDRDAVGSLLVRVSRLGDLLDGLDADRGTDPLTLVLVADTGLVEAGEARSILLDDDRVDLVGLDVALPLDGPPAQAARLTLDTLDVAVPATVRVPHGGAWIDAVAVVAEDGAESVGLDASDPDLASVLRAAVHAGATVRVDGVSGGAQALGLLAATAAALDARSVAQVHALLTATDPEPARAVLADASPTALRRRLLSIRSADPVGLLRELADLGLAETEA